jgi:hypothetical protein
VGAYAEEAEHVGAMIHNNLNIVQQGCKKYCVRYLDVYPEI